MDCYHPILLILSLLVHNSQFVWLDDVLCLIVCTCTQNQAFQDLTDYTTDRERICERVVANTLGWAIFFLSIQLRSIVLPCAFHHSELATQTVSLSLYTALSV